MKYALVNGQRREAERGLKGECQFDRHPMIPKCGLKRRPYWAHRAGYTCDHWWDNETQWHRDWKGLFPIEWQEVVHKSETGERHIADVKTDKGWVFEFQNSPISLAERQSRDAFYSKLIWVVNGTRRPKDLPEFHKVWTEGRPVGANGSLRMIRTSECSLLQEWASCDTPVFFDFGTGTNIWWLLPKCPEGKREYVAAFSHADLVQPHLRGMAQQIDEFAKFLNDFTALVANYVARRRAQTQRPIPQPSYRPYSPQPFLQPRRRYRL